MRVAATNLHPCRTIHPGTWHRGLPLAGTSNMENVASSCRRVVVRAAGMPVASLICKRRRTIEGSSSRPTLSGSVPVGREAGTDAGPAPAQWTAAVWTAEVSACSSSCDQLSQDSGPPSRSALRRGKPCALRATVGRPSSDSSRHSQRSARHLSDSTRHAQRSPSALSARVLLPHSEQAGRRAHIHHTLR